MARKQFGKTTGRSVGREQTRKSTAMTEIQEIWLAALLVYCLKRSVAAFVGTPSTSGSIRVNLYPPDDRCVGSLHLHEDWSVLVPELLSDVFEEEISEGHDDCGYHIHLNADPERGPAVNLAKFHQAWIRHRPTLYRYCPAPGGGTGISRGREYAETLPDDTLRWLNSGERYLEVNHTAIDAHTTVEVRLAAGTEDYDAFERWLRLVIAVGVESLFEGDPLAEYEPWVAQTTRPWSSALYLNAAGKHLVRLGNAEAAVRAIAVARAA